MQRRWQPFPSNKDLEAIIQISITSKLDCCNVFYLELSFRWCRTAITKLQTTALRQSLPCTAWHFLHHAICSLLSFQPILAETHIGHPLPLPFASAASAPWLPGRSSWISAKIGWKDKTLRYETESTICTRKAFNAGSSLWFGAC